MGAEEFRVVLSAIVPFLVFFLKQTTLSQQMEKLEKLIDLFHIYRAIEGPRGEKPSKIAPEKVGNDKSAGTSVAISEQLLNTYIVATLGLWTLAVMLVSSLMGLVIIIILVRFRLFVHVDKLSFLDSLWGDLVAIIVAELVVVGANVGYITLRKRKTKVRAEKIDQKIVQYLEKRSYSVHSQPTPSTPSEPNTPSEQHQYCAKKLRRQKKAFNYKRLT